ncbi:hypothetical protein [Aeoliella sp. SH292]|uniref:hypothetical protein n=1 Tax=Aeoliella sp. SH292 TaxID=3454464 RepID=UPI003F9BC470
MKYALLITGVLAGLALAVPDLVVLGYVLLIVPGLILTVAPTVFVYLALTAIIRRLLPISSPMRATGAAFAIALLLGWAVMQPFRWSAMAEYHASELPDVLPGQAIELDGHVRLERPDERRDPECDYLCLAVLDSPRVKSLTTVTAGRRTPPEVQPSAAYALVSAKADPAPSMFPSEPGEIVREYLPLIKANRGQMLFAAAKAVEASWILRLAGPEQLRGVNPVEAEGADWIIRVESPSNTGTSTLRRVTILDSNGIVQFRQSYRKQAVPARMLYIGFQAYMGGGTVSASFHVGRQILESGERWLEPESALLQAIKFPVPPCQAEVVELLREQTVQALDDPTATTARLELARGYLGLFFFDAKADDYELIARIVADDRVRDIDAQLENIFAKDNTPVAMVGAFVTRIGMDHTSPSLRHSLGERLASMPPGTFANPDSKYLAIWNSPEIYQQSAPLIATLADLGPERAMPLLDEMLDTAIEQPHWRDRRPMMKGIRAALVRLGPQASAAVPRIRELFLRRPSPIMDNAGDADAWRFALARMGVALEDMPVFPSQSPRTVEENQRRVAAQLRRYDLNHAPKEGI